jgi:hypothetical protein
VEQRLIHVVDHVVTPKPSGCPKCAHLPPLVRGGPVPARRDR